MFSKDTFIAPTIFTVKNTDDTNSYPITLFLSSNNRSLPNYGLPPQVNVTFGYNTSTYNYGQLLTMADEQPFKLWKFRYDAFGSNIGASLQVQETINVSTKNPDGNVENMPLFPYEDLDQTQAYSREFRYPFIINSDNGLAFNILPSMSMKFYLWYDMIASQTNLLMGGEQVVTMSKPFPLEAHDPCLVRIVWGERGARIIE